MAAAGSRARRSGRSRAAGFAGSGPWVSRWAVPMSRRKSMIAAARQRRPLRCPCRRQNPCPESPSPSGAVRVLAIGFLPGLDLDGHVIDPETALEPVAHLFEERVA